MSTKTKQIGDGKEPQEKDTMSFWGHLEELRGHLIRSATAILVMAIGAFIAKDIVFDLVILAPKEPWFITNQLLCRLGEIVNTPALCINQNPVELINIDLAGQFKTHITVSLIVGIIASFPYILWEFWRFIRPALHPKERANSGGAVAITSLLFLLGVSFSYFVIAPLTINFLGSYQVSDLVANQVALRSYISTITMLSFASGIVFELPVIVYFLSRVGIVTPTFMRQNRKTAFILIMVLGAVITPPDVFSQILVAIPLYGLYEISIGISRRANEKSEHDIDDI